MRPGVSNIYCKTGDDDQEGMMYKDGQLKCHSEEWNKALEELSEVASQFCRLCAKTSDELVPVFGEQGIELKLEEKIHTHLPIMITPEDLMPISLCNPCISKLEVCHQLVTSCLEADTNLRAILKFHELFQDEYADDCEGSTLHTERSNVNGGNSTIEIENNVIGTHDSNRKCEIIYEEQESYVDDVISNSPISEIVQNSAAANDYNEVSPKIELIDPNISEQEQQDDVIVGVSDPTDFMETGELTSKNEYTGQDNAMTSSEKGENKPKYKVVVVKLKSSPNVAQELQISKALQLLKSEDQDSETHSVVDSGEELQLDEHEKSNSGEFPYECGTCGKQFQKIHQLAQHTTIHDDARQHKCQICGKRFNRRGNMLVHLKRHQNTSNFTCKICYDSFSTFGDMLSHRKTHSKEEIEQAMHHKVSSGQINEIKCEICGKILSTKISLRYHMMTHSGEKPYQCDFCEKKFTMKTTLAYHRRTHTGEKPYQCRFCDDAFQSKQGLVIHERLHTGEKPFQCEHCPMAFRSRVNLNQHLVVHSEARPFTCPYCNRGFRRRDTLDVHVRTHTGERPYACQVCGRRFKQKGDCNKHQKSHFKDCENVSSLTKDDDQSKIAVMKSVTPSENYACVLCGIVFSEKYEMEQHFESFHSVQEGAPETIIISTDNIISQDNGLVLSEIAIVGNDSENIIISDYNGENDD